MVSVVKGGSSGSRLIADSSTAVLVLAILGSRTCLMAEVYVFILWEPAEDIAKQGIMGA